MIGNNFDSIVLTFEEKHILFSLRLKDRKTGDAYAPPLDKLEEYGLITANCESEPAPEGCYLADGTYSITDKGIRFRIYCRQQAIRRYITPVIVAFLTSIATNLLKELWLPALLSWLSGPS